MKKSHIFGTIIIIAIIAIVVIIVMQPQWLKNLMKPKVPTDGTPCTTSTGSGTFKNGICNVNVGPGGPAGNEFQLANPVYNPCSGINSSTQFDKYGRVIRIPGVPFTTARCPEGLVATSQVIYNLYYPNGVRVYRCAACN